MRLSLRRAEYAFLRDLYDLDRINLGMLAPSVATEEHMRKDRVTAARLQLGGYVHGEPPPDPEGPWGQVWFLTTKGLRALQRKELTGDKDGI